MLPVDGRIPRSALHRSRVRSHAASGCSCRRHRHGIEVQNSYVHGVPGWSGSAGHLAPMVMPSDSFVAEFTPPRAGTFIYHSHSNEYYQIQAGLAAPLIRLEPGEPYGTLTDRTLRINMGAAETADFACVPTAPRALVLDVTTMIPGWSIRVPARPSSPGGDRSMAHDESRRSS